MTLREILHSEVVYGPNYARSDAAPVNRAGLQIAGDWTTSDAFLMEGAVQSGIAAANRVSEYLKKGQGGLGEIGSLPTRLVQDGNVHIVVGSNTHSIGSKRKPLPTRKSIAFVVDRKYLATCTCSRGVRGAPLSLTIQFSNSEHRSTPPRLCFHALFGT